MRDSLSIENQRHSVPADLDGIVRNPSSISTRVQGSEPAVSVILPVNNAARYVEQSVRSILHQTLREFELVIGDDGSDDGSSEILARLAEGDSRIRLLRRPRKSGLAAVANWLVGEAKGSFVAIAHADDTSHRNRLLRQVSAFHRARGAVLVAALSNGIDHEGRRVHPPNLWRLFRPSAYAAFAHSSVMFRRDAFERVGGYRIGAEMWEDLDLYWRLAREGRILIIPEVLTSYRHSAVSVRERTDPEIAERAFEQMYRAAERRAGGDKSDPLHSDLPASARIRPKVFASRSLLPLWLGRRNMVLGRMLRNADWRLNLESLKALLFVAWGALSPRSLRFLVIVGAKSRNRYVRRQLAGVDLVEWRPTCND